MTTPSMDSKRLSQYPERVRQVKRLRKQVTGLTRAVRRRDAEVSWLSQRLSIMPEREVFADLLMDVILISGSFVAGLFLSSLG